jgi:hypothetical protein
VEKVRFGLLFRRGSGTFGVVNNKPVSARDAFAQVSARRNADNPWTAADEARASAKRAAEQAAHAKWAAANPQANDEQDDEQDDEEAAS